MATRIEIIVHDEQRSFDPATLERDAPELHAALQAAYLRERQLIVERDHARDGKTKLAQLAVWFLQREGDRVAIPVDELEDKPKQIDWRVEDGWLRVELEEPLPPSDEVAGGG